MERFAFSLVLVLFAAAATAQSYPSKPIQLIVPFPPGGPTDIVGRMVAQKISEGVGQPVVVENRAGAGGTVGSIAASKAAPDGYTLLYGSTSTLAIAPSLYKNLPYDPRKNFAPVSLVSRGPILIAVNAQVPAHSLKEFIELARKQPGKLSYSSAGNGTPPHLAGELFKTVAGVDLLQAIFEGQIALAPHLQSGKVRALAITGEKRSAALPEVPTVSEAGLPQYEVNFWS